MLQEDVRITEEFAVDGKRPPTTTLHCGAIGEGGGTGEGADWSNQTRPKGQSGGEHDADP